MKKLIMATAIVCAVCSAKAASISWLAYQYAGGIDPNNIQDYGYFVDSKGNPSALPTGVDICLCLMGGTSPSVLQVAENMGDFAYGNTYVFDYSDGILKDTDVLKVMARDGSGKFIELTAAANAEGNDATTFQTLTVSGLKSDENAWSAEFIYATGNYTASADVPEPTSGLLMLVGLAGLALRRKQK